MASQGSSTTASSGSTASALASPASSSTMTSRRSPVNSGSPSGYRPLSPGKLSVLAKPFYPTTGSSSSSMAAMAPVAPESLPAMASMPSVAAASSSSTTSDATLGGPRVLDPPPKWTRVSSFFTTDASGPPVTRSVWEMEDSPGLKGDTWPGVLASHMGLDIPTRDQIQQPPGAGQDEPVNGNKHPPGAGQDQQPKEAGQDQQPTGAGQDQQPTGAGQDQQPTGAGQDQQPTGAGQDQLGNGKQLTRLEQARVGRPMIKFGSFNPVEIP